MTGVEFKRVDVSDETVLELIASWYSNEWNIPGQTTVEKLKSLSLDTKQFQMLMLVDGLPVATGGLYNHVGLIDREPRFGKYKHWLALVYTVPDKRNKGYGVMLCNYIQDFSAQLGLNEIFLFTHTAESLYKRLGWQHVECLKIGERNIAVMRMELTTHH